MKTIERLLIKCIIIQIIFLFVAQFLMSQSGITPHLNQLYKYEGIHQERPGETIETIDRSSFLWYDKRGK